MSLRDDISQMIGDLEAKRTAWKTRASEIAKNNFEKTSKDVYEEFGNYQRNRIAEAFNAAVSSFYRAYSPSIYKRTNSLYGLLQLPIDEKGLVGYEQTLDLIDRGAIHKDRSGGDSLFQTVFMEGWHGGAKSISPAKEGVWGTHPNTGSAYYRKRGMVRYPDNPKPKMHRYGKWGRVAYRSEAPFDLFNTSLGQLEDSDFANTWQEVCQKHWDILCEKLQVDLNKLKVEIYG